MPDCLWDEKLKELVTITMNGEISIADRYLQSMEQQARRVATTEAVERRNVAGRHECRNVKSIQNEVRICLTYCYREYEPQKKKRSIMFKVGVGALAVGGLGLVFLVGSDFGLFGPVISHLIVGSGGGMTAAGSIGVAASTLAAGPSGIGLIARGAPPGMEKGRLKASRGPERIETEWKKDGPVSLEKDPWELCPE